MVFVALKILGEKLKVLQFLTSGSKYDRLIFHTLAKNGNF